MLKLFHSAMSTDINQASSISSFLPKKKKKKSLYRYTNIQSFYLFVTRFFIGLNPFLLFKCNIAHYLKTWCQFDLIILSILVGIWEISTLKLNIFLGCSLITSMQGMVATTIHDLCLIKCLKILYCMECCTKWFTCCRNILELFLEIKILYMSKCWSWNPKSKFMVSDKLF